LGDNPFVKSLVKACALPGQNALSDFDARISQLRDAFAGVARIDIHRADNYFPDPCLKDRIRAWGSTSDSGARFKSNVQRGTGRHGGVEITEAFEFGVLPACSSMVSFCHYPIVNSQNRSDSGIGTRLTLCFFGFLECRAHEPFISLRRGHERSVGVVLQPGNVFCACKLCKYVTYFGEACPRRCDKTTHAPSEKGRVSQ